MSNALFGLARNAYLTGLLNWTSDAMKAKLLDFATAGVSNATIASSTNATPIVITTNAVNAYVTGDVVVIGGHTVNTAANGTWLITVLSTTTFSLQTKTSVSVNSVGNGVGGATGYVVDLTTATNLSDLNASSVGTDIAIAGASAALGIASCSAFTFVAVPTQANSCKAFVIYKDTGAAGTSKVIYFCDGKTQVVCDTQAAATATAISIEPAKMAIPTATVIVFSNGASATLTSPVVVGDRSLAVSSLAAIVTAGATADVTYTSAGLPVIPNGGNITVTPDAGTNKLFAL